MYFTDELLVVIMNDKLNEVLILGIHPPLKAEPFARMCLNGQLGLLMFLLQPRVDEHAFIFSDYLKITSVYLSSVYSLDSNPVLLVSIWCRSNLKLGFNNSKLAPRRWCFSGLHFKPSLSTPKTYLPETSSFAVFARH